MRDKKGYYYYLIPKELFKQLKKYINGRGFHRDHDGQILLKTPYITFDKVLEDFKVDPETL